MTEHKPEKFVFDPLKVTFQVTKEFWFDSEVEPNIFENEIILNYEEKEIGRSILQRNLSEKTIRITYIHIEKKFQDNGFGKKLLLEVNNYIKSFKNKHIGMLSEEVLNPDIKDFYLKNGWTTTDGRNYFFNTI